MSVGDHTRFDREFDRRYAYGGCDLGAVCTPDRTVFKLWSPEASGVELFLYRHDTAGPWFDRRRQPGNIAFSNCPTPNLR